MKVEKSLSSDSQQRISAGLVSHLAHMQILLPLQWCCYLFFRTNSYAKHFAWKPLDVSFKIMNVQVTYITYKWFCHRGKICYSSKSWLKGPLIFSLRRLRASCMTAHFSQFWANHEFHHMKSTNLHEYFQSLPLANRRTVTTRHHPSPLWRVVTIRPDRDDPPTFSPRSTTTQWIFSRSLADRGTDANRHHPSPQWRVVMIRSDRDDPPTFHPTP